MSHKNEEHRHLPLHYFIFGHWQYWQYRQWILFVPIFADLKRQNTVDTTILSCDAYFGAYYIGRISINVVIARNEAICKYLTDNRLLRSSQWRSDQDSWNLNRPISWNTTILPCDSYCDTSGIRQNGIHYDILAVIQQWCRVTDNSCEVNKIQFTERCWL